MTAEPAITIRAAREPDVGALVMLIHEHADFERAEPPRDGLAERLPGLLFGPSPRLFALVADDGREVLGYATAELHLSTWDASEYLHLDCLFVRDDARSLGIGAMLLNRVQTLARDLGATEVQWQTPEWNDGAVRFYDRAGGIRRAKYRYSLAVGSETRKYS